MIARRLAYVMAALVLVASAVYAVIYLYRWEWNRALFTGGLFIATEVTLVAAMTFDRLRSVESKLDVLAAGTPGRASGADGSGDGDDPFAPRDHFGWLRESMEGPGVFLPILLGAGALVSALAWLSERMAFRIARRRAGVAGSARPRTPPATAVTVVVLALVAVGVGIGIDRLADATQTRVEVVPEDSSMEIVFAVDTRRGEPEDRAAQRLWAACASKVQSGGDGPVTSAGEDGFRVRVQPALDRYLRRELQGCLEDTTLDMVLGRVVRLTLTGMPDGPVA